MRLISIHMRHPPGKGPSRSKGKGRPDKQVLLLADTSISYQRDVLHGVARYIRTHGSWNVYLGQEPHERLPHPKQWCGDGVITAMVPPRVIRAVEALNVATVDVTAFAGSERCTPVQPDDQVVGRLAAEHFRERGLQKFAFCGFAHSVRTRYSSRREQFFVKAVEEMGHACTTLKTRYKTARSWLPVIDELKAWLVTLEKPIGIMACNDARAHHVLEACRQLGVHVPEEVAVLGVDNDPIICDFCSPPLSSVDLGAERIGYHAAEELDRLMAGAPPRSTPLSIAPNRVIPRLSTDVLATEDRYIADAIRFIRARACEGIAVTDVLARVPLNRRALERRFRKILGRSPHEEIHRVRIERARQLLMSTAYSLPEVAARSGFTYVQYLGRVFRKATGLTPGQFRKVCRNADRTMEG